MQTERDAAIVGWIGRISAADAEHVMAGLGWATAGPEPACGGRARLSSTKPALHAQKEGRKAG